MKLNNRERNLLIGALILIGVIFVYFYVITPIHSNFRETKDELAIINTQYKIIKAQKEGDQDMDSIITDYRDRVANLQVSLPSTVHIEEIIDIIFRTFKYNQITLNSATFALNDKDETQKVDDEMMGIERLSGGYSIEEILTQYEKTNDVTQFVLAEDGSQVALTYDSISNLSVNISFTSNYDLLKALLASFEDLQKTIIISNLNVSKVVKNDDDYNYDDNEVTVALSLTVPFYNDNDETEMFIYNYMSNQERDNHGIFEYETIENYENGKQGKDENVEILDINPDFKIALHSTASDLAAQSMSFYAFNDSVLNLNANRSERYILDLSENNGSVFFRFRNNAETYPVAGTKALTMQGEHIIVQVYSTSRITSDDLASMNLVLNNNTDKKVVFYVFYDDPTSPRFNLIVNSGAYEVIRN